MATTNFCDAGLCRIIDADLGMQFPRKKCCHFQENRKCFTVREFLQKHETDFFEIADRCFRSAVHSAISSKQIDQVIKFISNNDSENRVSGDAQFISVVEM